MTQFENPDRDEKETAGFTFRLSIVHKPCKNAHQSKIKCLSEACLLRVYDIVKSPFSTHSKAYLSNIQNDVKHMPEHLAVLNKCFPI